jgi:5'-deoxynucleotidase YfbR-like HD superfamily hydrolase
MADEHERLIGDTYRLAILLRNAGAVKRYHVVRTLRQQDVAAHSWGVVALVLCVQPQPSAALMTAAVMHDMPELRTGDVPATAKWESEKLRDALDAMEQIFAQQFNIPGAALTELEQRILKWCDLAELVFWCLEEQAMGNDFIVPLYKRGLDAMNALGHPTPQARNIFDYLMYATQGDYEDMVNNDGRE